MPARMAAAPLATRPGPASAEMAGRVSVDPPEPLLPRAQRELPVTGDRSVRTHDRLVRCAGWQLGDPGRGALNGKIGTTLTGKGGLCTTADSRQESCRPANPGRTECDRPKTS